MIGAIIFFIAIPIIFDKPIEKIHHFFTKKESLKK